MNISLEGKIALVCGSTQGIGLAIAKALASQGARCILLARNEESLKNAVNQLSGSAHSYAVADFTEPDQVKKVIAALTAKHPIHILINNTGGPAAGLITAAKEENFEAAFRQHIVNNHNLATAVLPGMKQAQYGRIINIISTSVRIPIANLGVSNTIRAATASWAKSLSNEVGALGITVNSILPGFIDTQRLRSLIRANATASGNTESQVEEAMLQTIPTKRFGQAEEIAAVAAFLASPAASYVNGVSIPVDGGKTGTI